MNKLRDLVENLWQIEKLGFTISEARVNLAQFGLSEDLGISDEQFRAVEKLLEVMQSDEIVSLKKLLEDKKKRKVQLEYIEYCEDKIKELERQVAVQDPGSINAKRLKIQLEWEQGNLKTMKERLDGGLAICSGF